MRSRLANRGSGRRLALAAGIVLALGLAAWTRWSAPSRQTHDVPGRRAGTSVLLITIDTLRADAIGAYGNARARTPWLDRLAAGGLRFDRAYAHNVVTLPSHANILSGRYPFDHGVRDNAGFRFPAGQPTLATLLRARGYRTGAFVSAFPLDSRFGLAEGFDVYDDSFVSAAPQPAFLIQERAGVETVARARAWLDAADPRPAFCWVHLYEPHFPYASGYDADVAAADVALGPLVEPILAGARPMLVVVTSDHGESLGEHGEATHGIFAYEATLKVPLVIHAPGIVPAAVVSDPVRHIDLLPTILDAVDVGVPSGLPGRTVVPQAARGEPEDAPIYFEALSGSLNRGWAPLRGVIRGSTKYVSLPIPELYDLAADRRELQNIASEEPSRAGQMDQVLRSFASLEPANRRAETSDTLDKLRALGYVAHTSTKTRPYTEDDDPKRLIALDALLEEVLARYMAGDVRGALDRCRELVRRRPSMAVSLLHLAHLERETGNLAAGIDALRTASRINPDDATTLALLAAYLSEAGRAEEAVQVLQARAARPDADLQLLVARGLSLAKAGRRQEALATFDRAIAGDPSNARLLVERGTVHLMAGDQRSAAQDFSAALTLEPAVARAHSSLGVIAIEQGRAEEAVTHWRRAVALDPGEYRTLLGLGLFHWRAGRRDEARVYLDFFLGSAPPARYQRELAGVREMLGRQR